MSKYRDYPRTVAETQRVEREKEAKHVAKLARFAKIYGGPKGRGMVDTSDIPEVGREFFRRAKLVMPKPDKDGITRIRSDHRGAWDGPAPKHIQIIGRGKRVKASPKGHQTPKRR